MLASALSNNSVLIEIRFVNKYRAALLYIAIACNILACYPRANIAVFVKPVLGFHFAIYCKWKSLNCARTQFLIEKHCSNQIVASIARFSTVQRYCKIQLKFVMPILLNKSKLIHYRQICVIQFSVSCVFNKKTDSGKPSNPLKHC